MKQPDPILHNLTKSRTSQSAMPKDDKESSQEAKAIPESSSKTHPSEAPLESSNVLKVYFPTGKYHPENSPDTKDNPDFGQGKEILAKNEGSTHPPSQGAGLPVIAQVGDTKKTTPMADKSPEKDRQLIKKPSQVQTNGVQSEAQVLQLEDIKPRTKAGQKPKMRWKIFTGR